MSYLNTVNRPYRAMIGVGGIGSGAFFALDGDHTLGREESRSGRLLDRRDYCKLHIVAHYVQALLGPDFETLPIGMVGDDDTGRQLIGEMKEAGLRVDHVKVCPGASTLYSFCFVYPDGSGGNLTTADSACSKVDARLVGRARRDFAKFEGRGIALAAPEVPLDARAKLLALGTRYGFLRAAAFTSEEMWSVAESDLLKQVDLLAMNLDEAAAAAQTPAEGEPGAVVDAAVERLRGLNPGVLISITAGTNGSWAWDGASLSHVPACKVEAESTAGAGDAHLAGILAGLAAGLEFSDAHELGALVAALSVTSPHTINKDVGRQSLRRFAEEGRARIGAAVRSLLEDR